MAGAVVAIQALDARNWISLGLAEREYKDCLRAQVELDNSRLPTDGAATLSTSSSAASGTASTDPHHAAQEAPPAAVAAVVTPAQERQRPILTATTTIVAETTLSAPLPRSNRFADLEVYPDSSYASARFERCTKKQRAARKASVAVENLQKEGRKAARRAVQEATYEVWDWAQGIGDAMTVFIKLAGAAKAEAGAKRSSLIKVRTWWEDWVDWMAATREREKKRKKTEWASAHTQREKRKKHSALTLCRARVFHPSPHPFPPRDRRV